MCDLGITEICFDKPNPLPDDTDKVLLFVALVFTSNQYANNVSETDLPRQFKCCHTVMKVADHVKLLVLLTFFTYMPLTGV